MFNFKGFNLRDINTNFIRLILPLRIRYLLLPDSSFFLNFLTQVPKGKMP